MNGLAQNKSIEEVKLTGEIQSRLDSLQRRLSDINDGLYAISDRVLGISKMPDGKISAKDPCIRPERSGNISKINDSIDNLLYVTNGLEERLGELRQL